MNQSWCDFLKQAIQILILSQLGPIIKYWVIFLDV